jgi:3-dehydroquinate synthase
LLPQVGKICQEVGIKGPLLVVSDNNVARHYAETVMNSIQSAGYKVNLLVLPTGEEHKTIQTLQDIWQVFLNCGMERNSTVIALGGGVVSDLAGFAAATYKRGIPWIVCPTTLLAMVDAGLGGKTGADLPAAKNMVGAFHAPQLVLVDPDCLKTLPEEELRNGMGEVIKHGIIADPELLDLCRGNWRSELTRLVTDAMAVKIKVICEDPLEKGRRAVLNLGHTVGHAIEQASNYRIRHGEAVALGLLAATQIAKYMGLVESDGLIDSIYEALLWVGLPTQMPDWIDLDQAMEIMHHDKKRAGGVVRFVLPGKIGDVREGYQVDIDLVKSVMTDLQVKNDLREK